MLGHHTAVICLIEQYSGGGGGLGGAVIKDIKQVSIPTNYYRKRKIVPKRCGKWEGGPPRPLTLCRTPVV